MATPIEIKKALANNATLRERLVLSGVLELVETVLSRDPDAGAQDSKLAESFFRKRRQKAQQYATAQISGDAGIDLAKVPNLDNIALGFASDLVDRAVADAGANPWEAAPDADAAAAGVVAALTDEQIVGGAELSFNGLAGVSRAEMERVIALGLWSHPFGLPE